MENIFPLYDNISHFYFIAIRVHFGSFYILIKRFLTFFLADLFTRLLLSQLLPST